MEKIKKFISRVSKLHKLIKYLLASSIEYDFTLLVNEFDGYMRNLKFSFIVQSRDEMGMIKGYVKQIREILFNVYGVSESNYIEFLRNMHSVTEKNIEFQKQDKHNVGANITNVETNEPLLNGGQFHKTNITRSKRIEKRISITDCTDVSFKEFSNTTSSVASSASSEHVNHEQTQSQTQIEIRRQVNILKQLKNSDHIIRFFGVAQEDSKFYLVTEWMEYGNLHEYYTNFKDNMDWETKIRFALDICRGVAYLHECKVSY